MNKRGIWFCLVLPAIVLMLNSCSKPLEWPPSPLYVFGQGEAGTAQPADLESAMDKIVGHYAHYDVVAYEDTTTRTTMRTFIISYGFTDFYIEDGKLMQSDRFVHAEQKLSRKNAPVRLKRRSRTGHQTQGAGGGVIAERWRMAYLQA